MSPGIFGAWGGAPLTTCVNYLFIVAFLLCTCTTGVHSQGGSFIEPKYKDIAVRESGPGTGLRVGLTTVPTADVTVHFTAPWWVNVSRPNYEDDPFHDAYIPVTSIVLNSTHKTSDKVYPDGAGLVIRYPATDFVAGGIHPDNRNATLNVTFSYDPNIGYLHSYENSTSRTSLYTIYPLDGDLAGISTTARYAHIVVRIHSKPTSQVTVTPTFTGDAFDLTKGGCEPVSTTPLTFAANVIEFKNVDLRCEDPDRRVDNSVHTGLVTWAVSSTDPYYNNLAVEATQFNVSDHDVAGIGLYRASHLKVGVISINEGTQQTFRLALTSEPHGSVNIALTYVTDDSITMSIVPDTVTLGPSCWTFTCSPEIVISANEDTITASKSTMLHLANITVTSTSSDPLYSKGTPENIAQVEIVDNEVSDKDLSVKWFYQPDLQAAWHHTLTSFAFDVNSTVPSFVGCGTFVREINFGNGVSLTHPSSSGTPRTYLVKWQEGPGSTGPQALWALSITAHTSVACNDLTIDHAQSRIYATGGVSASTVGDIVTFGSVDGAVHNVTINGTSGDIWRGGWSTDGNLLSGIPPITGLPSQDRGTSVTSHMVDSIHADITFAGTFGQCCINENNTVMSLDGSGIASHNVTHYPVQGDGLGERTPEKNSYLVTVRTDGAFQGAAAIISRNTVEIIDTTTDAEGFVYVVGYCSGNASFVSASGNVLTIQLDDAKTDFGFVARYKHGEFYWAKGIFGTPSASWVRVEATSVTYSHQASGDYSIFIGGVASSTSSVIVNKGEGSQFSTAIVGHTQGVFVAKLSRTTGQITWVQTGSSFHGPKLTVIAIDPSTGHLYASGAYQFSLRFSASVEAEHAHGANLWIALFDKTAGTPLWMAATTSGDTTDTVTGMTVDPSGQVTLAGKFSGGTTFGSIMPVQPGTHSGKSIFLARLNIGHIVAPDTAVVDEGLTGTYAITLGLQPLQPVTVNVASLNTGRLNVAPATLVFNHLDWSTPATVTMTPVDDNILEADEVIRVQHSVTTNDVGYGRTQLAYTDATVRDDDPANFGLASLPSIPYDAGTQTVVNFVQLYTTIPIISIELQWTSPGLFSGTPTLQWLGSSPQTANLVYTPAGIIGSAQFTVYIRYQNGFTTATQTSSPLIITDILPDVQSISPIEGPAQGGTVVTITGLRLGNPTAITIGGNPCTPASTGNTDSQLVCTTPTSAVTGTPSTVLVTTVKGADPNPTVTFLFHPAGRILAFDPNTAFAYQSTLVTMTGTDLARSQSDLNPPPSVAGVLCASYTFVTNTTVTCMTSNAPAQNQGLVAVTSMAFGVAYSTQPFRFLGPVVSSVSPQQGDWQTTTAVEIRGTAFGNPGTPVTSTTADSVSGVTIGTIACNDVTHVSDTFVTCVAPPHPRGDFAIRVVGRLGGPSMPADLMFTYAWPPPLITSFTPSGSSIRGGVEVTITGQHFGVNSTVLQGVKIGTIPCASYSYISDTQVRCIAAPVLAGYFGKINVTSSLGGEGESATSFVYGTPYPYPTSVTPSSGPVTGGSTVTIKGEFLGVDPRDLLAVTVAGEVCTLSTWVSEQELHCKLPASGGLQPKSGNVTVTTRNGDSVASSGAGVLFNYVLPAPVIVGAFPRQGDAKGGTRVTIVGEFFANSTERLSITIAGAVCTDIRNATETSVTCLAPAVPTGFDVSQSPPFIVERKATGAASTDEGLSSAPTDTGFRWFAASEICPQACGLYADCVYPNCVCRQGYFGAPACNSPLLLLSPDKITTCEDECVATVRIRAAKKPTSDVTVTLSALDLSEVELQPTDVKITPGNWEQEQTVQVTGRYDMTRDGSREYKIVVAASKSNDPAFNNVANIPPVKGVNIDSKPAIYSIEPPIVPLNGSVPVTLIGRNFDAYPLITIADNIPSERTEVFEVNITRSNVTFEAEIAARLAWQKQSREGRATATTATARPPAPVAPAGVRVLQATQTVIERDPLTARAEVITKLVFEAPRVPSEGYRSLSVRNSDGLQGSVASEFGIYYSDDCPAEGYYGRGSDCIPCPTGGYCPGGYRIWPVEGWWNPGERSGGVWPCSEPARERCVGGQTSLCGVGYQGPLCSECAAGFFSVSNTCQECESEGATILLLVGDLLVWMVISMAVWWIEKDENLGHVIAFVLAVQEVGSVGEMIAHLLPDWLLATYNVFYIFSGDVSFLRPNCYGTIPYEANFWIQLAYTCAVAIPVIFGVPLVSWFSRNVRHKLKDTYYKEERRRFFRYRMRRAFTIWLLLMYYPLSKAAISSLACSSLANTEGIRLLVQPDTRCFTLSHIPVFLMSLAIVILVTIGYPALYIRRMIRHKHDLYGDPAFYASWDFLYDPFLEKWKFMFILEFVILGFLAVGTSVLAGNILPQFIVVGGAFATFCAVLAILQPMRRRWENAVAFSYNFANLLAIFLVFALHYDILPPTATEIILYLLVTLVALCIFTLGGVVIYFLFLVWDTQEENVNKDGARRKSMADTLGTLASFAGGRNSTYSSRRGSPGTQAFPGGQYALDDDDDFDVHSEFELDIRMDKNGTLKKSDSMMGLVLDAFDLFNPSGGSTPDNDNSPSPELSPSDSDSLAAEAIAASFAAVGVDTIHRTDSDAAGATKIPKLRAPPEGRRSRTTSHMDSEASVSSSLQRHVDDLRALSRAGDEVARVTSQTLRTNSGQWSTQDRAPEEYYQRRERALSQNPMFQALSVSNITPTEDSSVAGSEGGVNTTPPGGVAQFSRHESERVMKRDRKGSNGPLPLLLRPDSAYNVTRRQGDV
eukprot:TRINITY_DN2290_c0_g4_i8.p1 TRINITY_DN2290_c0_g4~~TRINITY_DN2290_c0_g4_i8.p1  ORF type:complete len:2770 (+),score=461.45 TRINITY_DN2290_c0_g4_i8:103-8412(+)